MTIATQSRSGTISIKPSADRSSKFTRKPKKPKPLTGHELMLQSRVEDGLSVVILMTNGDELSGKVIDFDKYSICLKVDEEAEFWAFKHSVDSIKSVQA